MFKILKDENFHIAVNVHVVGNIIVQQGKNKRVP
jgi:hypothetical protein